MPNKLPVSRLIRVDVNLSPAGAQAQALDVLLVLGGSEVIDTYERVRSYTTIEEVAADFSASDPEYKSAELWFSQSPQPTTLMIGRWAKTNSPAQLVGGILSAAEQAIANWTAIANGSFKITIDGGVEQSITGLDFSLVTNLNGVATVINAALSGADIEWRANEQRFRVISDTAGASSAVTYMTAGAAGTSIADDLKMLSTSSGVYQAPRTANETGGDAVEIFDDRFGQQWYAVMLAYAGEDIEDDVLAVSAFVEAANTKHIHGVTTQDTAVLSSVDTSSLAYQLEALGYRRTCIQYSSSSAYAIASFLGRILTVDYDGNSTTIDLMYKDEPGVVAENLTSTQMAALEARQCNVFVEYENDTSIIEPGNMSSGDPVDLITGVDWFAVTAQTELFNVIYTNPKKIPQTDAGAQILVATVTGVCTQAVTNGFVAPGTWNSAGFGLLQQGDYLPSGFYVYIQPIDEQSQTDRETRVSPPIQVALKTAGAIRTVDLTVNINR